jgi:hypothetical protein
MSRMVWVFFAGFYLSGYVDGLREQGIGAWVFRGLRRLLKREPQ